MMYAQRLAHWPTHNKRSVNGSYFYDAPVPRQEARCLPGSVCLCRVETSEKPRPFSCPCGSQTAARTHRPQTRSSVPRAGMNGSKAQRAQGCGLSLLPGGLPTPGPLKHHAALMAELQAWPPAKWPGGPVPAGAPSPAFRGGGLSSTACLSPPSPGAPASAPRAWEHACPR